MTKFGGDGELKPVVTGDRRLDWEKERLENMGEDKKR